MQVDRVLHESARTVEEVEEPDHGEHRPRARGVFGELTRAGVTARTQEREPGTLHQLPGVSV
jgi:hypothetical protein